MSRKKSEKLKQDWRRAVYYFKHDFLSRENIIILIVAGICLILTFNTITAMTRNWELTERLASERKSLELLKVEVETAELENEYYRTNEYQELAARKLANKQLPGEHLVYLPKNTDQAKNKHREINPIVEKKEVTNLEKWMSLLFPNNS